jgi:plastocyanin
MLALTVIAACGGGAYGSGDPTPDPTSPPSTDPLTVAATPGLTFGPASLTVKTGETVTFDFGSVAHNVFFDHQDGAPSDIAGNNANVSIKRSFAAAGTYHYTCHIHPSMQGTIVVQ